MGRKTFACKSEECLWQDWYISSFRFCFTKPPHNPRAVLKIPIARSPEAIRIKDWATYSQRQVVMVGFYTPYRILRPLKLQCKMSGEHFKGWSQNWVKIFYLYNVKIKLVTPSLPSIFTDEFSPTDSYDGHEHETC